MKQLLLQTGCEPFSNHDVINRTGTLLSTIVRGCAVINDTSVPIYFDILEHEKKPVEPDSGAVMYIIAVLVFYAAGIVTMIVKYLIREKRDLEEEKALEDFFRTMPAYKKEREMKQVNRVAIHAFHALTSFSYDDGDDDDSITTDEGESVIRGCEDAITEVDHDENETVSKIVFDLDENKESNGETENVNASRNKFVDFKETSDNIC